MPNDKLPTEPELFAAAYEALRIATADGGYPHYHYLQPEVTQGDRLKHAFDHAGLALFGHELGELEDPEHHVEHAIADLAIVLARRYLELP